MSSYNPNGRVYNFKIDGKTVLLYKSKTSRELSQPAFTIDNKPVYKFYVDEEKPENLVYWWQEEYIVSSNFTFMDSIVSSSTDNGSTWTNTHYYIKLNAISGPKTSDDTVSVSCYLDNGLSKVYGINFPMLQINYPGKTQDYDIFFGYVLVSEQAVDCRSTVIPVSPMNGYQAYMQTTNSGLYFSINVQRLTLDSYSTTLYQPNSIQYNESLPMFNSEMWYKDKDKETYPITRNTSKRTPNNFSIDNLVENVKEYLETNWDTMKKTEVFSYLAE